MRGGSLRILVEGFITFYKQIPTFLKQATNVSFQTHYLLTIHVALSTSLDIIGYVTSAVETVFKLEWFLVTPRRTLQ